MQDAFMSMEATIPEVLIEGRLVQMSLNQVRTLHFISMEPGIHQKDIARSLVITQASVSVFIRKMISLGLIEKRTDKRDGRAHGLFLSELGKGIYAEIRRQQIAVMRDFMSPIPIETQRIVVESIENALVNSRDRS
jgi:DNA-binding MarR family transcriptional regulator